MQWKEQTILAKVEEIGEKRENWQSIHSFIYCCIHSFNKYWWRISKCQEQSRVLGIWQWKYKKIPVLNLPPPHILSACLNSPRVSSTFRQQAKGQTRVTTGRLSIPGGTHWVMGWMNTFPGTSLSGQLPTICNAVIAHYSQIFPQWWLQWHVLSLPFPPSSQFLVPYSCSPHADKSLLETLLWDIEGNSWDTR